MVAHGFTGVDDVFAGERNFFVAYGRKPDPTILTRKLGVDYEIMNTNIKRWSVGSPIQAPLDSLMDLIREHASKLTMSSESSCAWRTRVRTPSTTASCLTFACSTCPQSC
jgi:2-methylcitrate dehydratase PrpD